MRNRQLGLSLGGLVIGAIVLVFVILFGLKIGPDYLEYFTIKEAITAIANSGESSPLEIRKAFEARQAIDDMPSIKPSDLEITHEGGATVISFSYRKEVPLIGNMGVYMDFQASAAGH